MKYVMTVGGNRIYAGSLKSVLAWKAKPMLILNCGGEQTRAKVEARWNRPGLWGKVRRFLQLDPEVVTIDWPDFGLPSLDKRAWEGMARALVNQHADSNIGIHCWGGLGRTGTALAILAGLTGQAPLAGAVQWVRNTYNQHAVETEEQVEYVGRMLGVEQSLYLDPE